MGHLGPGGGKGQYTSNHQYDPHHGVMPELHAVASIFWCKPGHRYPGGAFATSFPGDYPEISPRLLRSWVRRRPDGVESAAADGAAHRCPRIPAASRPLPGGAHPAALRSAVPCRTAVPKRRFCRSKADLLLPNSRAAHFLVTGPLEGTPRRRRPGPGPAALARRGRPRGTTAGFPPGR